MILPVECFDKDELWQILISKGNDEFLRIKKMQDAHVRLVNKTAELIKDYVKNGDMNYPLSEAIADLKEIRGKSE